MAADADFFEGDANLDNRPLHIAYLSRKIPCPNLACKGEAGRVFFEEAGLHQHFRVKHIAIGVPFDKDKYTREAKRLLQFHHGQETKKHLERISAERQIQGSEYERFTVATSYEACRVLELVAKDPTACAKLTGILLLHFGHLRAYGDGASKPEVIQVNKPGLSVPFNTWHSKTNVDGKLITVIKTEAIFVKREFTVEPLQECTMPVSISGDYELTGDRALDILRGMFHLQQFRGSQQEAVNSILDGQNTILIMPTGGGKTICYAVPALMEPKITVVVFPLLALMFDQVERMRAQGLNVCYLLSDMDENEKDTAIHKLQSIPPEYNFLFVTPETVLSPVVFELMQTLSLKNLINFFVIDEAHCIDAWGFHFRPSYAELWKLGALGHPMLVMTGTATERTVDVMLNSLRLPPGTTIIKQSSNRPNLVYNVLDKRSDGKDAIVQLIKSKFPEQCGIVYCVERRDTVDVAYHLRMAGINAVFFHAGMDVFAKQQSIQNWKSGGAHVMCATVAFGMGIDKKNVKFVIHHSMPKDLESYVQESGRAGRDGSEAHCYIMFRFEDRTKHLRNIASLPDTERKLVCLNGLNDIVKYCIAPVCRRQQIVNYFNNNDTSGDICNKSCDICSATTNTAAVDNSEDAIEVINCLESMQQIEPKVTAKVLVLTFRGSKANNIVNKGFTGVKEYGKGKQKFTEKQLLKFVQCLIIESILQEQLRPVNENVTTPYLVKGANATKLINKEISFYFYM